MLYTAESLHESMANYFSKKEIVKHATGKVTIGLVRGSPCLVVTQGDTGMILSLTAQEFCDFAGVVDAAFQSVIYLSESVGTENPQ